MSIGIREMTGSDVDAVADVHLSAFPRFFLSFLGRSFLRELYRAILADNDGIAFVAVDGEKVVGFVAGSGSSSGFYRRAARRRWRRFGFASFGAFVRRPSILPRLLRALYAPPRSSREGVLLMSVAIHPGVQHSGAGTRLTNAFIEECRRRGASNVVLTTDRLENDAVNAFYRRLGFELAREYVTPEGRAMNEYIRYIGPE